jgi:ABC-type antimicrobial peptide transport system permease subunit
MVRYSLVCNDQGGVRDDVLVYCVDEDEYLMVCNAANRHKLLKHFAERKGQFAFKLEDETESTAMVAIQGPKAMDIIARMSSTIPTMKRYRFMVKNLVVIKLLVSRTGYTGEDGVEVILPSSMAKLALGMVLKDMGGDSSVVKPVGLGARDTLRMGGQADTGPRVGPLMVKIRDPARAEVVAAQLNELGGDQWKAWTRQDLADANASAMFEEGILVIIIGGCVVLGTIIGVAITWQTLRGAIMANIKEFASLRALGVGMGSLRRIVVELSFWVGVVGVAAAIGLTWLVALFAGSQGVLIALQPFALMVVGGGLIAIAMVSGLLSLGILKNSQPADLLR